MSFTSGPITQVRPHQVPGFQQAWDAGLVPVVPPAPPPLLPGPSADQLFWRLMRDLGIGVVVLLVVLQVADLLPGLLHWLLMVGGGLAGFVLFLRGLRRVGERNLEELARGYTTYTMVFGDFWYGGRHYPGHRMPWDYTGGWVLHRSTGAVVSEPQRWREPPGLYPSPHRPGAYELWTGVGWSGHLWDGPGPGSRRLTRSR